MNSDQKNPYVGARTFEPDESDLFFGREREANDLLSLVISDRLVLFYAQSGAGKSSLINTRLIPGLIEEEEYKVFPVGRLRRDETIDGTARNIYVYNLITSLTKRRNTEEGVLATLTLSKFFGCLDYSPQEGYFYNDQSSHKIFESDAGTNWKYVLIIDQFEELFTTHEEEWEKREDFFRQLARAMEDFPHLWVVLVMREDYIAYLDPYVYLLPGRLRTRYYMQRLDKERAIEAVEGPVRKSNLSYAVGAAKKLVDELSNIMVRRPDNTWESQAGQYVEPVQLQVVCSSLWNKLPEHVTEITQAHVDEYVVDMNQALGNFFEDQVREVANGRIAQEKGVKERDIRRWFEKELIIDGKRRNMVAQEAGGKSSGLADVVIREFLGSLVREEKRGGGATFYELTHDRMVEPIIENNRKWDLENSSPFRSHVEEWEKNKRNRAADLISDQALITAEEWAENNPDKLTEAELEYLEACREMQVEIEEEREFQRQREEREREMQQQQLLAAQQLADEQARSAMKARRFSFVMLALVVVAILTSLYAFQTSQDAFNARNTAQAARSTAEVLAQEALLAKLEADRERERTQDQVEISRSGDLLALSSEEGVPPDLAMLLRIEAFQADKNPRTRRALLSNLQEYTNLKTFLNTSASQVLLSPDGNTLATLEEDGIVFWNVENHQRINQSPLNGHFNPVYPVAVSPDGKILVSGSKDSSIRVWDVEKHEPLTEPLREHTAWVDSLTFSPDGSLLASSSDDATVILWEMSDPSDPNPLPPLRGHSGWISTVVFSTDGNLLASSSSDGTIILWNIREPRSPQMFGSPMKEHLSAISSIALAKQDTLLVSASYDGTIRLWDITDPEHPSLYETPITLPDGISQPFYSVAVSPDGELLVAGAGRSVSFWNIQNPELPEMIGEPITEYAGTPIENGYLFSMILLDEETLVASSTENILIWDLSNPESPVELTEPFTSSSNTINTMSYSPTAKILATGNMNGSVSLWELSDIKNPQPIGASLFGHPSQPYSMEFSSDGEILFSIGGENVTIIIDVNTTRILGQGSIITQNEDGSFKIFQYIDSETGDYVTNVISEKAGQNIKASIPGQYLGVDASESRIAYETISEEGDKYINIWDLATGKTLTSDITGLFKAFSQDSTILIVDKSNDIENPAFHLVDIDENRKYDYTVPGTFITISPDGKSLIYTTEDEEKGGFIHRLDIKNGKPIGTDVQGVYAGRSSNGKLLAFQSYDNADITYVNLMDTNTGNLLGQPIRGAFYQFNKDNNVLIYTVTRRGSSFFGFIDTGSGKPIGSPIEGHFQNVYGGSNRLFFTFLDVVDSVNHVGQLDLKTGTSVFQEGYIVSSIPEYNRLVIQVYDPNQGMDSLRLLDMQSGSTIGIPQAGSFAGLSPDKKTLIYHYYYNNETSTNDIRLLDVISGVNKGAVTAATFTAGWFTSDQQKLVYQTNAESNPSTIGLLDLTSGQTVATSLIKGNILTFSSGSNLILSRDEENMVYIWDVSRNQAMGREMEASNPRVQLSALSPDQQTLALVQADQIHIQNALTGEQKIIPYNNHTGYVSSVKFSPDGKTMLSSGNDGKAIIWDLDSLEPLHPPITGFGVGYTKDGTEVILKDLNKNQTTLFDIATYQPLGNPIVGSGAVISPDGNFLVVTDSNSTLSTLWNLNTLEQIGDPIPGNFVLFSPNNSFLAIGNPDNKTYLLNLTTLAEREELARGYPIGFSPDGKYLVIQDQNESAETTITAFRLTPQGARRMGGITSIQGGQAIFSPDSNYLFIDYGYSSRLWNLSGQIEVEIPEAGNLAAFSPGSQYLILRDGNNLTLWDIRNREILLDQEIRGETVAFSPDDRFLAVGDSLHTTLFDLTSQTRLDNQITGTNAVFSPDGRYMALTSGGIIRLWNLPQLTQARSFQGTNPSFTPDGKFLMTTKLILNLDDLRPIDEGPEGSYKAEYSPDNNTIAIIGDRGIILWYLNTRTKSPPLLGHAGSITQLQFSPDSRILASIASDGILLTDVLSGEPIGGIFPGSGISFHPDGKTFAVSENNKSQLWEIGESQTINEAGRPLDGGQAIFSPDGSQLATVQQAFPISGDIPVPTDTQTQSEESKILVYSFPDLELKEEISGAYAQFTVDGKLIVMSPVAQKTNDAPDLSPGVNNATHTISIRTSTGILTEIPINIPCDNTFVQDCLLIAFNSDGSIMAYSEISSDFTSTKIYFWDTTTNARMGRPITIRTSIQEISFISDDKLDEILVVKTGNDLSTNIDDSFMLFDVNTRIQVSPPLSGSYQAYYSEAGTGTLIYSNGSTGNLMFWDLDPANWESQLCSKVGRNFTQEEWKQYLPDKKYEITCSDWLAGE